MQDIEFSRNELIDLFLLMEENIRCTKYPLYDDYNDNDTDKDTDADNFYKASNTFSSDSTQMQSKSSKTYQRSHIC